MSLLYGFVVVAWLVIPGQQLMVPFVSMEACEIGLHKAKKGLRALFPARYLICISTGAKAKK